MDSEKAQRSLLGGIEHLIEVHYSALLPKVPHILKVQIYLTFKMSSDVCEIIL
jgi:hypothetical protein